MATVRGQLLGYDAIIPCDVTAIGNVIAVGDFISPFEVITSGEVATTGMVNMACGSMAAMARATVREPEVVVVHVHPVGPGTAAEGDERLPRNRMI